MVAVAELELRDFPRKLEVGADLVARALPDRRVGGNPAIPGAIEKRPDLLLSDRLHRPPPSSPPDELIGEIADGLAVDHGAIPFAHRFEIGGAFAVWLPHLEAAGVQKVGGGGEHVGRAVAEVDMAVAVEIDAIFDVG